MPLESTVIETKAKINVSTIAVLFICVATATIFLGFFAALAGISIGQQTLKSKTYQVAYCQTNDDCRANQFCQFESCPASSTGTGICVRVPNACIDQYNPVCGCDGQTYSNSCQAQQAKANIACPGACPCPTPKVYQGNDLKLAMPNLVTPFTTPIVLERIAGNGDAPTTKIYTLQNKSLTYQSTVSGFVDEVIAISKASDGTSEWLAITVKSDIDFRTDAVWTATSLDGPWQRDYGREKALCYKDSPCDPESGLADLAIIDNFDKDSLDGNFIATGPGCLPNASLDGMVSWLKPYVKMTDLGAPVMSALSYLYFGGECPLDDAFAARVALTRRNGKVTGVNFDSSESLWNPEEEVRMGNRRVGAILTQDNYVVYSGEGWIGKAPQLNPQGNWKFPIWHTQEEYLYPRGILKVDDLIIVYGFDKAKAGVGEMIALKISRDQGETFSSIEDNLRNYLGSLLPTLPYTMIERMSYDGVNKLIYLVINEGLNKNDLLFILPYQELLNWL